MRNILHLDLDAFFASVEQLDQPELRGRPVIVGGTTGRGVVSAASYEARRYGVRSAMPMGQALARCPQAVVRPVRMSRYRELSAQVFAIFRRYTDRIEPLSIDEAFLDVTGSRRLFGSPREIAVRIRTEVRNESGLTVSAGVAPNKLLAKLASEAAKPDGLWEIPPDGIDAFLLPLPVARLWGIGPRAAAELRRWGIHTIADLRQWGADDLERCIGRAGRQWYDLCRGQDEREVESTETIKSVGHEETYATDLISPPALRRRLLDLAERVAARLRRYGLQGRTVTLKVRYAGFDTHTRQRRLAAATDQATELYQAALTLLARSEAESRPVRLLGLTVSDWVSTGITPSLFDEAEREERRRLDRAVDAVRQRFGREGVVRGSLLEPEE